MNAARFIKKNNYHKVMINLSDIEIQIGEGKPQTISLENILENNSLIVRGIAIAGTSGLEDKKKIFGEYVLIFYPADITFDPEKLFRKMLGGTIVDYLQRLAREMYNEISGTIFFNGYFPFMAVFKEGSPGKADNVYISHPVDVQSFLNYINKPNLRVVWTMPFHTHSRGTIEEFGEIWAERPSGGDLKSSEDLEKFWGVPIVQLLITPRKVILYGKEGIKKSRNFDGRDVSVKDEYVEYKGGMFRVAYLRTF